jgi:hypothetical protein
MHSNKLNALQQQRQQSHAERLFGKDAGLPLPPPEAAPEVSAATGTAPGPATEGTVVRRSYCILRGRIEQLASIKVMNRKKQQRVFPWSYFAGANMDDPGELVLIFDGPEGPSLVTVSGKGLDVELLAGVEDNRVEWICELDEVAVAAVYREDPTSPVVTGISIQGGGREWSRSPFRPGKPQR